MFAFSVSDRHGRGATPSKVIARACEHTAERWARHRWQDLSVMQTLLIGKEGYKRLNFWANERHAPDELLLCTHCAHDVRTSSAWSVST
jgi:hypothetical protein